MSGKKAGVSTEYAYGDHTEPPKHVRGANGPEISRHHKKRFDSTYPDGHTPAGMERGEHVHARTFKKTLTSTPENALWNSCLYPKLARSSSSARAIAADRELPGTGPSTCDESDFATPILHFSCG